MASTARRLNGMGRFSLANKGQGAAAAEFGEMIIFLTRGPNKERYASVGMCLGLVTSTQEVHVGTLECPSVGNQEDRRAGQVNTLTWCSP